MIVRPETKHSGTFGITSLIGHMYEWFHRILLGRWVLIRSISLDEGFKSSSYLTETLLDPEFGHANEPNKAAVNKALNFKEEFWSWLERPDNRLRLIRFGTAMNGRKIMSSANSNTILQGPVILRIFIDQ